MRKAGALRQWYKRIKRRRGVGIARVAVMRKLATIFRRLVSQGKTYGDCRAPRRRSGPARHQEDSTP